VASISSVIALSVAIVFALIGVVQLAGPRFVREAYERWDYPQRVRLVTGVLDLMAALLLASPELRAFGIALAGLLTFGSVVVLLAHRHYLNASLAIVLMAALVPATLAVPRPDPIQFVQQPTAQPYVERAVASGDERDLVARVPIAFTKH
jgi:hypothetical protein